VAGTKASASSLKDLSDGARHHLRWVAFGWMMGVMVFNGVNLMLKKPTLMPFSGTHADPVMRVIMFAAVTGLLATVFKFPAVLALGPWLERRLRGDEARKVRVRDIFHPSIRAAALWGGGLQFVYQVALIALVTGLSPAGISAAKACIIIPLAALELFFGQLKPKGRMWWLRLGTSVVFTIAGASIVIFEGGFKLFEDGGVWALAGLVTFALLGNGLLAYAEIQEYRGVHVRQVAAPVYSLARVVAYVASGVMGVFIWGTVQAFRGVDAWGTAIGVIHMCIDRWELVLPVAVIGAICDTSRICVKAIITATYMYTMLAPSIVVDLGLQWPAKNWWWSSIYDNVHPGFHTLVVGVCGAAVLAIGIALYPRPKGEDSTS
jgi:hypothetical protein